MSGEREQDDDGPAIGVAGQHCDHWYEGAACCYCGAPAMTDAEMEEQGMNE